MKLKRGVKYVEDIQKLKKLRAQDKEAYLKFFVKIIERHNVSDKTVYRDMKKKFPGTHKIRTDRGKFRSTATPKAVKIISEVRAAGKSKGEAVKIAEKMTGKNISSRVASRTKSVEVSSSNFGAGVKEFIENLCGYKLMSPDAGLKFRHNGFSFIVNKEDVGDIILVLTNAYNRSAETSGSGKLPLDKNELFRKKIFQLLEFNIKLAEESADLRSLESITRMYNSIQEDHELGADFEIVYGICSALKPGISRTEVISLIKQYAK